MKRICFVFLSAMLISLLSVSASADSREYKIDNAGMNLTLPGIFEDAVGNDVRDEDEGECFSAFSEDGNRTFSVTAVRTPVKDYNLFDRDMLSLNASRLKKEVSEKEFDITEQSINAHKQALFVRTVFTDNNGHNSYIRYSTIYDNRKIDITFSCAGKITEADEEMLCAVIESVVFETPPQERRWKELKFAFLYDDCESGVSFSVPEGWEQVRIQEEKNVKAVFRNNDLPAEVRYLFIDEAKEAGEDGDTANRIVMQNVINSEEYISLITGADIEKITEAYIGKKTYYRVNTEEPSEAGYGSSRRAENFILAENGCIYWFQLLGDAGKELPDDIDFRDLVWSAVYEKAYDNEDDSKELEDIFVKSIAVAIAIEYTLIVLIVLVPVVIYRFCIRRSPVDRKTAEKVAIIYAIVLYIIGVIINKSLFVSNLPMLFSEMLCFADYLILKKGYIESDKSYIFPESDDK